MKVKPIVTKERKFQRVFDMISDDVAIQGRFNGVYPNLHAKMSEEQRAVYSELNDVNFRRTTIEGLDDYITKAVDFYKEILELVPKPIKYANGTIMDEADFDKKMEFLSCPEHDGFDFGSQFSLILENGSVVKKHSEEEYKHIYGLVYDFSPTYYDMPEWLLNMSAGRYTIDGYRFDVRTSRFYEEYVRSVSMYVEDEENHPLFPLITRNNEKEEDDEVNCYRCGDGGCIHCEPQFFM